MTAPAHAHVQSYRLVQRHRSAAAVIVASKRREIQTPGPGTRQEHRKARPDQTDSDNAQVSAGAATRPVPSRPGRTNRRTSGIVMGRATSGMGHGTGQQKTTGHGAGHQGHQKTVTSGIRILPRAVPLALRRRGHAVWMLSGYSFTIRPSPTYPNVEAVSGPSAAELQWRRSWRPTLPAMANGTSEVPVKCLRVLVKTREVAVTAPSNGEWRASEPAQGRG
jgi:hypothetical protein